LHCFPGHCWQAHGPRGRSGWWCRSRRGAWGFRGAADRHATVPEAWPAGGGRKQARRGGNLGTQTVLDSEADGYSILLNTVGMHAVNPLMFPDLRFNPGAIWRQLA
jgi:hypothetical protein